MISFDILYVCLDHSGEKQTSSILQSRLQERKTHDLAAFEALVAAAFLAAGVAALPYAVTAD